MLFASFLAVSRCAYVEINQSNIKQHIGGPDPIFVKFYRPSCPHCQAMTEEFAETAAAFDNLPFGGVDCSVEKRICDSHKINKVPTLRLFLARSQKGIDFRGDHSLETYCDFLENHTTAKARRPPKWTTELHPLNFDSYLNDTKCLFVTFYAPYCPHCKHFLPVFARAAKAFLPDRAAVTFGKINCAEYQEFCGPQISGYPTMILFRNGTRDDFKNTRTVEQLANFLNERCGTERGEDGLLTNQSGIIPEASALVQEFITAEDKSGYLEKMKQIPGAEFYAKVLQRYIEKGPEQLEKDKETMAGILREQKGSWASLDGMKKRFNVLGEFFPKPVEEEKEEVTTEKAVSGQDGADAQNDENIPSDKEGI